MPTDELSSRMVLAIENEMKICLEQVNLPGYEDLHSMMAYHLGWEGAGAGPEARGKRIRPLLVLLTSAAAGGKWEQALPAAASVELLHNFSLIHDDIEDGSQVRRGRPTVWAHWGIAQAINTGDAMFSLANLAVLGLAQTTSGDIALDASQLLQATSLHLTLGQFLDISYETRSDMALGAYWPMITGKTAALVAACTDIGALVARADSEIRSAYRMFGHTLGLAFQAIDDLLGIWGDEMITGKSAGSDLVTGKKSLPVVFGLDQAGEFAKRWRQGPISSTEVSQVAALLEQEGGREYTQTRADELTQQSLAALEQAKPSGEAGELLRTLALNLLNRRA